MNIAIIGTGSAINASMVAWSEIPSTTIVGILNVDKQNPQQLSEKLQAGCADDLQTLQTKNVDVVDICLPMKQRETWIKKALDLKSAIVVDVPFSQSMNQTQSVIDACNDQGSKIFPKEPLQHMPAFLNAQKQVKNDAIGKPGVMRFSVHMEYSSEDLDIFTALGTNLFIWLGETFGKIARVTAKQIQTNSKKNTKVVYAVAILRFIDGTIAQVDLSRTQKGSGISFELTGNKGMLHYDSKENTPIHMERFLESQDTHIDTSMILTKSVLQRQLEIINESIQEGIAIPVALEQVINAMDIAQKASESAENGKPVVVRGYQL